MAGPEHQKPDSRVVKTAYRVDHVFRDIDLLTETARAWDLEFRQVARGEFEGHLLQVGAADAVLSYARFNRALDQRGTPPPGMRTFVVPAHPQVAFFWRGRTVHGNQVLLFPRGGSLESLSRSDFAVHTISISDEMLHDVAETLRLAHVLDQLDRAESFATSGTAMERIRRAASAAYSAWTPQAARHVAGLVLLAIDRQSPATGPDARARVLELARGSVEDAPDGSFSVREWASRIRVHERTLQRAFDGFDGVSPKSYLLALRLNAVRRTLRTESKSKIGDAARRHGFWHMGQFAADYRRFFGVLPSDTTRDVTRRPVH